MENKFNMQKAKRRRICGNCRNTIHPGEFCLTNEFSSNKMKSHLCLGCVGIEMTKVPWSYGCKTWIKGASYEKAAV
jgi:RNase P subunit RPR2